MSSTKHTLRLAGAFAALATLALAVSCRGFFVNPTVTSLAIGPTNLSLAPSQAFQMSATATYSDGSTSDATGTAVWVSSDENVATFPTPGDLTAVSLTELEAQEIFPGTTSVSASIGTVTSSSQTVNVCPVVQTLAITVNGSSSSASVGGGVAATFIANATFNGVSGTQNVSASVTWNIANTAVIASITGSGTGSSATATGVVGNGVDGMSTTVSASLCNFPSNTVTVTANTD
ncbi:MAG: Ig-like domain-containing protein [Candidatus Sulfotelmatobacter sp.]